METFKASHPDEPPDITIEAPDSLPPLRIDRARILQVLINLMENARSHASGVTRIALRAGWPSMEEGASIPGAGSISSAAASHSLSGRRPLRLRVCNDGVPIPPEALPRIFEPFFTGGRGTGLGLAIVRRLVEEHGGAISVISNAEIGTEFSIDLPSEGSAA
jgi:signal transduction histidine kinase